jgi:hypothetical protein
MTVPPSWYPERWGGHFPIGWSLLFIVGVIGGSMVLSVLRPKHSHGPA